MRYLTPLATALALAATLSSSTLVLAHGGNDHVRGTVTAVTPQSITVQTTEKATKTLTVSAKTEVKGAAKLADVKVGDRVVVDVPEGTTNASLIQVGAPPAKPVVAAAKPAAPKKAS